MMNHATAPTKGGHGDLCTSALEKRVLWAAPHVRESSLQVTVFTVDQHLVVNYGAPRRIQQPKFAADVSFEHSPRSDRETGPSRRMLIFAETIDHTDSGTSNPVTIDGQLAHSLASIGATYVAPEKLFPAMARSHHKVTEGHIGRQGFIELVV